MPRPAIRYYGGKHKHIKRLLEHMPPHTIFVDVFGGGANVLLNKAASKSEVYNDINQDVVNFFRVLRDNSQELARLIDMTPVSRYEYELAFEPCDGILERARRFYVRSWLSYAGAGAYNAPSTFRHYRYASNQHLLPSYDDVMNVAHRLRRTLIECRDYHYIITTYDSTSTFMYIDPPYYSDAGKLYVCKFSHDDHIKLAQLLSNVTGYVMLSGARSELYDYLYQDWRRVDWVSKKNGAGVYTESVWMNYDMQ
jgi:DNA adenine methylase